MENPMDEKLNPLVLTGTPRQRGRAHGESLRPAIREGIARWKACLGKNTGLHPDRCAYLRQFLAARDFLPALQKWTPGLVDEIEGIAEGAGLDFPTVYAWQLVDEEWLYRREAFFGTFEAPPGCSGIGVFGDRAGAPLLAQTMDIPGYYHDLQTILHIQYPHSDLEAFVFTIPGMVAINGLNNHGVGVCVNTLSQLQPARDGLPVAAVLCGILECKTGVEAEGFVRMIRHASGQNYLIGSPQGITSLECSASKVVAFAPSGRSLPVWHTNHPLVNDDTRRFWNAYQKATPELKAQIDLDLKDSTDRCVYLERELADASRGMTVESIHSILSVHDVPVCVDYQDDNQSHTYGCLIMELAVPPVLHITLGPPCSHPLQEFRYST